jgi:cytochrome c peroxidase
MALSQPGTNVSAMRTLRPLFSLGLMLWLCACNEAEPASVRKEAAPGAPTRSGPEVDGPYQLLSMHPSIPLLTDFGRQLFMDPSLSASGNIACASCHDPRSAYGPANGQPTQRGGEALQETGLRAAPSLRYLHNVPPFAEHHFDETVDESVDQGPTGGRMWDGRASSAHDQASLPLLSAREMANSGADAVATVVAERYKVQLQALFGPTITEDRTKVFSAAILALEVFEQSPVDFYPFSSRYDNWLRGKGSLSPREQRGLALFNDPSKGNCASCHPSQIRSGSFPLFTDFGYAAVAPPRNRQIAENRDPTYFDLGLCGPQRRDLNTRSEHCGKFRVPSLRNVALRGALFHNGVIHNLRTAVEFYAQRDVEPEKWYGRDTAGRVIPYDDLPAEYRINVSRERPLDRKRGQRAALSAADIDDIVLFLGTLTDADMRTQERSTRIAR